MRSGARNLLLAGVSCAVVFGGAEIILRVTGLAPSRALRSPDLHTLDSIPGLFDPGQEFTDLMRRDLPARIRINNLGMRGRDLPERKPANAWRLLCLGDSYTFGDHVNDEDAYPARLEEEIRKLRPREEAEVLNAGVNGFGLIDEAEFWKEKGRRLDPDVIVLTFSPNDISDMTRPVPVIDQMREHAAMKERPLIGPALRCLQNTATFNALQMLAARLSILSRSHDAIPEVEPARAGPEAAPRAWEEYRRALVAFGADVGRRDGRVRPRTLLVLYPSYGNATGAERSFASEILPAWAGEAGFECLDLLPIFSRAASLGDVLYLVPKDPHPSPAGHRLAAAAIAARLDALNWLVEEGEPGPAR